MGKLIELDAIQKAIIGLHVHEYDCLPKKSGYGIDKQELFDAIYSLPQVDIEEVKNTAWENGYAAGEKGGEY